LLIFFVCSFLLNFNVLPFLPPKKNYPIIESYLKYGIFEKKILIYTKGFTFINFNIATTIPINPEPDINPEDIAKKYDAAVIG
jgi:hypothetical protein